MRNTPFFIVGIGRSGTSLLRMMFHNHPRIAIPYESQFITKYHKSIDSSQKTFLSEKEFHQLLEDILAEPYLRKWDHTFDKNELLKTISEKTLSGILNAIYSDYAKGKGKPRWGDKSDYLDQMHTINTIFPDSQFIHIIRDGRDVASSVMKLPWGPNDIITAAEWWNKYIWLGRRVGAALGKGKYTEVFYEKLIDNPAKELKQLCAFLGEDYSSDMLNYHQQAEKAIPEAHKGLHYNVNTAPKKSRAFAWKREMSPCDIAIFNKYASEMLTETRYEMPDINLSRQRILLCVLKVMIKRFIKG